jgi:hypothetical protein
MDKSCKDKLLSCRTYAEAKPILETSKVGLSAHELAHTAFSIQEKQPELRDSFLKTVIQEMEDCEKKVEETDDNSDHQSSSTDGLEKVGTEHDAPEGMGNQYDPKDQMGVAINETFPQMPMQPPQAGGFQQQAPPMQPPMQPPRPPMNPQQQMQYTISEAVRSEISRTVAPYYNKLVEAVKALDTKVQETAKAKVSSLDLGEKMGGIRGTPSTGTWIKETTGSPEKDLDNTRREIEKFNEAINSGYIK